MYIEIFLNTNLLIRDRNNNELNTELNRYYSAKLLKFVTTDSFAMFCRKHSRLIKQT